MEPREVVVYWPQRRLRAALQGAEAPQDETEMPLYLLGFSATPSTVCVVDITRDFISASGKLTVIGVCYQSSPAKSGGAKSLPPSVKGPQLVVECGDHDASRSADALDRSLRGVSLESPHSNASVQFHFVFYDPLVLSRWNFTSPSASKSPPHLQILTQLREHCEGRASRSIATAAAGSLLLAVDLPFSVARALWTPVATALEAPVLQWLPVGSGASLLSYSQTLTLLNHRVTSLLSLPIQVRGRRSHREAPTAEIVDFLVYLLVDYLLGLLLCSFLAESAFPAATEMNLSLFSFLDAVRSNVIWLMDAPAGFKLNVRLAAILGNGILMWLDFWQFLFKWVIASVPWQSVASSSSLQAVALQVWRHAGATLQLSAIADLVWLVTWNSYWICQYFTKLNAMQLRLLSSLWKLFLGKKNNVLRKRVDSCEYDVNQLLLGTLLFTIVVFLVTTNAVFFVFFSLVRFGVWLSQSALWLPIVLLRGIPLASLAHRLFMPRAYTSTLTIEALDCPQSKASIVLRDVSAGRRRERDDRDRAEIRDFLSQTKAEISGSGSSVLFQVVPRASGVGQLFHRLQAYQTELARAYNGSSIVKSCLFGSSIPEVDAGILFPLPPREASLSSKPSGSKSKVE